jgi:hypothetical protein
MKAEKKKEIIQQMLDNGELDYGASQPKSAFLAQFGVVKASDEELKAMSPRKVREQIANEQLAEVGILAYVRDQIRPLGRHLDTRKDTVRVALPSENKDFIDQYLRKSKREMRKAQSLLKGTPPEYIGETDQSALKSLRQEKRLNDLRNRH